MRSISIPKTGRESWAGKRMQTKSRSWWGHSLENSCGEKDQTSNRVFLLSVKLSRFIVSFTKLPFQLTDQDEVGCGAGQRGSPSYTGCIRNTDQETFPHLHLIHRLWSDLLRCPHVSLLHPVHPLEETCHYLHNSGSLHGPNQRVSVNQRNKYYSHVFLLNMKFAC